MKDLQACLEKLRTQTAECETIRDLATKRELFTRLAEHFKVLTTEIEKALPSKGTTDVEVPPA